MPNSIEFREKLTNFYRYPSICGFQDTVPDRESFMAYLQKPSSRKRQQMIYIHVPFCSYLCNYCPFYKLPYRGRDTEKTDVFVDGLCREIEMYAATPFFRDVPITNVNMGGGTPMLLEIQQFERIITMLRDCFNLSECKVFSIEGDALSLQDVDKLRALKSLGVTRTSFGIQTFNESLRKKLNVLPKVKDVYQAAETVEKANFEWGCDILYNCPDQTVAEIEFNVDRIVELGPWVVDAYDLNISPNTKLQELVDTGRFSQIPNNQSEIAMFRALKDRFTSHGFWQPRSVNFMPRNFTPHPNGILHAFSADLIALGPSARTFLFSGGRNYRNHCDLGRYLDDIRQGIFPVEAGNKVPLSVQEERDMMLFPYYLEVPKASINQARFKDKIDDMIFSGYVEDRGNSIALTKLGRLWAGNVQYYFHGDAERERMARSMFLSLQHKRNLFNQDKMNVPRRPEASILQT